MAQWCTKAYEAFLAILQIASRIILYRNADTPHCQLSLSAGSQPRGLYVISLVALAEIVYLQSDKPDLMKVAGILQHAKTLYRLVYGEEVTFQGHCQHYRCRAAFKYIGTISEVSAMG